MNCNQNTGCPARRPGMPQPFGMMPNPPCAADHRPMQNQPCMEDCRSVPNPPGVWNRRPMPEPSCGGTQVIGPNMAAGWERYPVGMGYVPMQNWEVPFPMERGFQRGTIFPSLDYPFVMGRCRR